MDMKHCVLGLAALLVTDVACDEGAVDLGSPGPAVVPPLQVTGACTPTPVVLAHIAGVASRPLAIDWANLYVVASVAGDPTDQTLWRVPLSGQAPQVVADRQDHVGGIAIDPSATVSPAPILWSTGSTGPGGTIWRNDAASGTAAIATNRTAPGALIVLGERVYWAEGQSGGPSGGSIEWAPVTGGDASVLQQLTGDDIPRTFDGDEGALAWTTEDPALGNAATAQVVSVPLPLPFGVSHRIAQGAAGIALTYEGLVYSGPTSLTLAVVYADGTQHTLQTIPVQGWVQTIAANDGDVYYVDPTTHALMKTSVDDDAGTTRRLAEGIDPDSAMRADGTCVYWIDASAQAVMMVRS
jgi:hypothetical protein